MFWYVSPSTLIGSTNYTQASPLASSGANSGALALNCILKCSFDIFKSPVMSMLDCTLQEETTVLCRRAPNTNQARARGAHAERRRARRLPRRGRGRLRYVRSSSHTSSLHFIQQALSITSRAISSCARFRRTAQSVVSRASS